MAAPHRPPVLSDNALAVLERRYLVKDIDGHLLEAPEALFRRVADFIAEGDKSYGASEQEIQALSDKFYALMSKLEFLPNSPTLMNAGRPLAQLSACFVLPIDDTMGSIFETLKHTALIHQSGGGTGFSFSKLRPAGDIVKSSMGVSSGPVSFMEVYNAATEAIKQGGTRRGANMAVLSIDHPDIEQFITAKNDLRKVTNFNISVTITDEFMEALAHDADFSLRHPGSGQITKILPARQLFDKIVDSAWKTGEPGMIFVDEINRQNPTPEVGMIESTNPCGEVPLLPYEACNLGSINLGKMLIQDAAAGRTILDWDKLAETVRLGVHFLENVIVQNKFPIPEIEAMVHANRKIGLGVMGWADALLALGIPYDTDEAVQLGREVAAWIDYHSKLASVELAKARGAFPNFKASRYADADWLVPRHQKHLTAKITQAGWKTLAESIAIHGLRHATTTCIAPTGTISIIANASGGIEPVFAFVFTRNIMDNTRLLESHPYFESALRAEISALKISDVQDEILKRVATSGGVQEIVEISEEFRRLFVTSFDIAPEWHVKMQAAWQEFSDNGVSKTINFSESATRQEVASAYHLAYKLGIKGITIYRNNSRADQPMALSEENSQPLNALNEDWSPVCLECD
ncbi:MAG: adenosylcobalamin-dependent ribonucleoside-diphosphate reductase [Vampirovibrionales bacterium]|nr:adenosylcobalamin-dependent ribonucleoside-diphosphate reductase [Vampirovibrionales bacterium]